MKAKINLKNIYSYLIGNYRYRLYYTKQLNWLLRPHIAEQITYRINSMDADCFYQGQCKMCGCQTTALQMANKACDKPCYPSMISRSKWKKLKGAKFFGELALVDDDGNMWGLDTKLKKFVKFGTYFMKDGK